MAAVHKFFRRNARKAQDEHEPGDCLLQPTDVDRVL
jgi:hypothetical protein